MEAGAGVPLWRNHAGRELSRVVPVDKSTSIAPDVSLAIALDRLTRSLQKGGVPDAALDARIFLEDAVALDRASLLRHADRPLGAEAASTLRAWLARRLAGEPVWRILGKREFWGLPFAVTPDVLDPRPDTETLVRAALDALGPRRTAPLRLLDLGVGSGALLAALLTECPQAVGWGVDRSLAACRVTRQNIASLCLGSRALVINGDWGTGLPDAAFDLVVSNPPYIETATIATLDREVRDHDPLQALDGGPDGLGCYRRLAADLPRLLASGGRAVLESGVGQAPVVRRLLAAAGLTHEATGRDLGGIERAIVMRRP